MKLNNNQAQFCVANNSPSFQGIRADKLTYKTMLALKDDIVHGERFRMAFRDIVDLSQSTDIEIDLVNTGSKVSKILPDGQSELLALDPKDFVWGLMKAVSKLKNK